MVDSHNLTQISLGDEQEPDAHHSDAEMYRILNKYAV